MHILIRAVALFAVALSLSSFALAHVVVSPKSVPAASLQTFTVSVPTERTVPTIKVAVDIPPGLNYVTPFVKPGWKVSTVKNDAGDITRIEWSGGSIPADFKDVFQFSVQTPVEPTTLVWKAYQTYQDGEVVAWDQVPAAKGHDDAAGEERDTPYSQTVVMPAMQDEEEGSGDAHGWPGHDEKGSAVPLAISVAALALAAYAVAEVRKCK